MSKVISNYFDDANRGLQKQHAEQGQRGAPASTSHVQLPPLRSDSAPPGLDGGGVGGGSGSWDSGLRRSGSMGAIGYSQDQLASAVQAERYQQMLLEHSKMSKRMRALQEQLSITSAKKEAFKAQAQKLEKEFKKGREQADSLQKELLEARNEAGQCAKDAQEAMKMMTDMRKAHIHEVRLLQRGLQARGSDAQSRNKVDEVADLVDKVGRAVLQRDEAIRDKTKMQVQLSKAVTDCRALTTESTRLRRQNKELTTSLKEALRKAKFVPPKPGRDVPRDLEDSDEEFEQELAVFEKRFEILEEGPAGLDILASNLSKEKQALEQRVKRQQETVKMLNKSLEDWKAANAGKDEQIQSLNVKIEKMLADQALLNEQIAQKRREIELQVEEEKAALEARIEELKGEVDLAQAQTAGIEKVSSRLTQELVKVHGQYGTLSSEPPAGADQESELLAREEQYTAKTGERLQIEVRRSPDGVVEMHANEVGSGDVTVVQVPPDFEFDSEDQWGPSFLSRVGVSLGPPRKVVLSEKVDRRSVSLPPSGTQAILAVYKYGGRRFYFSGNGMEPETFRMLDLVVMQDQLPAELCAKIDKCKNDSELFDLMTAGVSLKADGSTLNFSASAAINAA